jgi:hypothetical protein
LKKLDALDAQRRTIEEAIKPDCFAAMSVEPAARTGAPRQQLRRST